MDKISLTHENTLNATILPNEFIDRQMVKADGEYVKIYLLILRLMGQGISVSTDLLADRLELTRKDIIRALRYWEKEGLLSLNLQEEKQAEETLQAPLYTLKTQIPLKQTRNASELEKFVSSKGHNRLIFMAETYIGHPLSVQELNSICYISNDLHFSTDLLEYLVEYCSEKGKKQLRYIEKVAINWYEQGIDTVKKAMDQSALYNQNVFSVMKAFGISGRNPGQSELDYINSWNSMGFESDIIIEACNRTLLATHQASFPYANRILEGWKKAGVRSLSDVLSLDKDHNAKKEDKKKLETFPMGKSSSNAFHNFDQRSYDYDDLEARLAGRSRR